MKADDAEIVAALTAMNLRLMAITGLALLSRTHSAAVSRDCQNTASP